MANPSSKDKALDALRSLPEDATLDDAIERLCFLAKVEAGLEQSQADDVVPHEEVRKRHGS